MMNNNNDNKGIKFTGDPVAFDGVEGKRDPKTGKGRFDLIPTEVFYPLFSKADHDWLLDCHPASILMAIANEKFIEAIIKMTIYAYAKHNEDYAASSSEFWHGVWPMLQDLAIHFQKGAEHYGERNCQKGIPLWSFKDSAMRHATQVFEGKTDEPHKISVIWNCWMAQWTVITSNKKDDTDEFNPFEMTLKILRDRRKNAKEELFNIPSESQEFKEKKNDIDEMKRLINALSQLANELNIPVVTAQQTSYTREEVEAIKKEAADKAIEDFLNDRSSENVDRIIKEIGSGVIVDRLKTIPLAKRQLFDKQFADLLSTPEGKDRARWFYDLDDLFKDLIDRIENKRGLDQDCLPLLIKLNTVYGNYLQTKNDSEESNVQKVDVKIHIDHETTQDQDDYYSQTKLCRCPTDSLMGELHKRLVLINKSEKIVKLNFVTNNREKLAKLTHLIDAIKRCDVDSKTTVDTVEIQKIIHQLREEMKNAYNVFTDTDGKYVRVFFNQLRPGMNNMIAMWNSIALLLNNEKTPEQ